MADVRDKCTSLATEITTLYLVVDSLKKDMANLSLKSSARPVYHPPERSKHSYARVAAKTAFASTTAPTATKA